MSFSFRKEFKAKEKKSTKKEEGTQASPDVGCRGTTLSIIQIYRKKMYRPWQIKEKEGKKLRKKKRIEKFEKKTLKIQEVNLNSSLVRWH